MNYRNLGSSGLKVSELSFGAWVTFGHQVDIELASRLMTTAYDAGVNFFDNAEVYAHGQAEDVMGAALKKLGWRRDSFIVSSKVMFGSVRNALPTQRGLSRKHVMEACHQAMARLGVDYLDLYFCHRPDPETPIEETVYTMNDLIRQGKILYWGTSEWSAQQLMEAHGIARQHHLIPPTMEQPQYNMFHRYRFEVEYGRLYRQIGLGTTIWSPLASGLLTGKYAGGIPTDSRMNVPGYEWLRERLESEEGRRQIGIVQQLSVVAQELEMSMPQLAVGWTLKNPNVSTVILGASKVQQLQETLESGEMVSRLTDDVMERLEGILQNKPEPLELQ